MSDQEAREAAAKALHDATWSTPWEPTEDDAYCAVTRDQANAAIDAYLAALPVVAPDEARAEALRDAADAWHSENAGTSPRMYRWLVARAESEWAASRRQPTVQRPTVTRDALADVLDEATSTFGTGFWATGERDALVDAILAHLNGEKK